MTTKIARAFVNASTGAYLFMALSAIMGKPLLLNLDSTGNILISLIAAILLHYRIGRSILPYLYGVAAIASFGGFSIWAPTGGVVEGVAMAAWDLILAVALGNDLRGE